MLGLAETGRAVDSAGAAAVAVGAARWPVITPDYCGVVIPPNVAPLNFRIEEAGEAWRTRVTGQTGDAIEIRSDAPEVRFPARRWRELLKANRGQEVRVEIAARQAGGGWISFGVVTNRVAREPIDSHLVYRLLRPAYSLYGELGIYQRDIESDRETPILENRSFDQGCVNCHTFNQNRPDTLALHIRSKGTGNPILISQSNAVVQVSKTAGYLSWHPSGRLMAFSSNHFRLFYHTTGEARDVFDSDSDLGIYRLDENRIVVPPGLARPDRLENWPCWAPDGRFLYFTSAARLKFERFDRIRYDLMRASYSLEQDRWGEAELLLSGAELLKSVNEPRVSPDGRWLLCCLLPYGNFPPYQVASDLYLLDLETRAFRPVAEINSDQSDSYGSWSSNGRWVVFSSKRIDGLFSRPYFSYMDEAGQFSKPWVLPQSDPGFYESCIQNYNRPELIDGPVKVSPRELVRAIHHPRVQWSPQQDGAPVGEDLPYEQASKIDRGYAADPAAPGVSGIER